MAEGFEINLQAIKFDVFCFVFSEFLGKIKYSAVRFSIAFYGNIYGS